MEAESGEVSGRAAEVREQALAAIERYGDQDEGTILNFVLCVFPGYLLGMRSGILVAHVFPALVGRIEIDVQESRETVMQTAKGVADRHGSPRPGASCQGQGKRLW